MPEAKQKNEMVTSVVWMKTPQGKKLGLLGLNISGEEWRVKLEKSGLINVIRVRDEDECPRYIKELIVRDGTELDMTDLRVPFIILRLPVDLKETYKVRVLLLEKEKRTGETFLVN